MPRPAGGVSMSRRPKAEDPTNSDPPLCVDDCIWRQKYTGFALQRNALRSELASMIEHFRCGWNLKPGLIGGQPLDYAPCTHLPESMKGVAR